MGRSKSVPQLLPVPLVFEDQPDISTPASKKTKKKKNESAQILDPSFKDQHEISTPASKKIKLRAEESTELNTRIGKEISANSRGRPRRFGSSSKNKEPMLEGVQVIEGNKQRHKNSRGEKNGTNAASGMGAMEEKINHLIVLLEERKASEAMFSRAQHTQIQNPSLADMKSEMRTSKYKTMYIDCEKKIKDLKHENYGLRKKLEATTGKLEEYEKGQLAVSRSSHKFDNSCLASTMTKAAQAILDLSSPPRANTDDLSSPVVSREPKSFVSKELKDDDVVKNMSGKASGEMKRSCRHCGASKTPQWRVGPMGPRTLCNACGVRYRSGKLVPEYRPLASPSFNGHVHSNMHKKVMGNIPDHN